MGVIFQPFYVLPRADLPLTHARIVHAGNWFSGGTASASGTNAAFFEDAPMGSLTYEKWRADAVPATWEYDHGSEVVADAICIAAHTLGTSGATFKLQYHDGSTWVDLTRAVSPENDMPVMAIFEPVEAQRWRISISAASEVPDLGVFRVADTMQMPRPLYGGHAPMDMSRQTVMRQNNSETGEFLGKTRVRSSLMAQFEWRHLDPDWVRSYWRPFMLAIETDPYFIAWRPGRFPEVAYVTTAQAPIPQNMGINGLMQVSLTGTARGYD
ncbi:hypothetical protein FIU89_11120 [Roseovarius sp. THAF27]|uniref:hypothetical protein n=1 Tax=Roseovarius sp. THAF27 TaxID=2587850 RepID=UPI001268E6AB|nr:hypothetical protein [Roseovarius sp. THAF27]QFT81160.1 hypothetical protein FIU89_11120 [Roseovarius sp. THAF27]